MVTVTLGDFVFTNLEIPPSIPLGGTQALAVHNMVGGLRNVDAMGPIEAPLEWVGLFFGENALDRAKYLDNLRVKGKPLSLTWSDLDFIVVIDKFVFNFDREWQIPYSISCVVIKNNGQPVTTIADVQDLDFILFDQVNKVETETIVISSHGDGILEQIKSKVVDFKAACAKVNSFIKATTAVITDIKNQIQDVEVMVTQELASINNFVQNVTTLGGILPYNPVSINAANMLNVATSLNNQSKLLNLKYSLGSINKDLAQVKAVSGNSVSNTTTTNNIFPLPTTQVIQYGNLYQLASMYYGDAMKWVLIANENGLSSPYVNSPISLRIPVDSNSTGGVLNA